MPETTSKFALYQAVRRARATSPNGLAVRRGDPARIARLAYNTAQVEGVDVSYDRLVEIAKRSTVKA